MARMPDLTSDLTRVLVPLRWSDMDAFAHVNNVSFLRLLEDARVLSLSRWFAEGLRVVDHNVLVARHEIEYLSPLEYRHDPVAIDIWVTRVGAAGYDLGYIVTDPPEVGEQRYAVAASTMACYDFDTQTARRMNEHEREALAPLLGPPPPFRRRR
ncbi:MAG: acyl-CoA thioesterase [Dermatophilaceae bacterium]